MLTKKCICGYHIYNTFWSATVGEELQCAKKLGNVKDRYVTLIITCFMGTTQGQLLLKVQAFKYGDSHTNSDRAG